MASSIVSGETPVFWPLCLFDFEFHDAGLNCFLDEARQLALASAPLTGKKLAQGIICASRDDEVPAVRWAAGPKKMRIAVRWGRGVNASLILA